MADPVFDDAIFDPEVFDTHNRSFAVQPTTLTRKIIRKSRKR